MGSDSGTPSPQPGRWCMGRPRSRCRWVEAGGNGQPTNCGAKGWFIGKMGILRGCFPFSIWHMHSILEWVCTVSFCCYMFILSLHINMLKKHIHMMNHVCTYITTVDEFFLLFLYDKMHTRHVDTPLLLCLVLCWCQCIILGVVHVGGQHEVLSIYRLCRFRWPVLGRGCESIAWAAGQLLRCSHTNYQ